MAWRHRWAHLLKQQSSITFYRLPTKENKLSFSVCIFRLQQTNGNCRFLLYPRHVCVCLCVWGCLCVCVSVMGNPKGKPRQFSLFIYLLLIMLTEGCSLSDCWWRNKRKLFVCKQTKRTCPSMLEGLLNLCAHVNNKSFTLISNFIWRNYDLKGQ
jgi:hypothetical protein